MADGDTIEGLIKGFDAKAAAIDAEIKAAHQEIEQSTRAVEELRRAHEQKADELRGVQQQLSQLRPDQQGQKADLTRRHDAIEKDAAANADALARQQAQLSALTTARKEEAARQRLEHERGQFVLALSNLLNSTRDGPVRFLIATRTLEVLTARGISPDRFQSVTDQKTIADLLAGITAAASGAIDADRAQAARFLETRALARDIATNRDDHVTKTGEAERKHAALDARKTAHETAIAELSRPEEPAAHEHRHKIRNYAAIAGAAALAVAAVLGGLALAGIASGTLAPLAGLAAVLGAAALAVAWLYSDAHRRGQLASHQRHLQSVVVELKALDAATIERERAAQALVASYVTRLGHVEIAAPALAAGATPAAAMQDLLAAAQGGETAWRAQHPDIRLFVP